MSDEQDYKDYQDYQAYQQHLAKSAAPQAPAVADPMEAYKARHAGDSTGQKLKSLLVGDSDNPTVQGMPPMVAPASALPGVANVMGRVGQSAIGRIGMGAAQGGIGGFASGPVDKSLDDRLSSAKGGALLGGAVGMAAEGVGSTAGLLKSAARKVMRVSPQQAQAYVENPAEVQGMADSLEDGSAQALRDKADEAKNAIQNTRRGLVTSGREESTQLRDLIKGKTTKIRPADWQGLSPELDDAIQASANQYGQIPGEVEVPLGAVQSAKRLAQSQASYKPGTVYDPTQTAKMADMGNKASKLRQMIEDGAPDVKPLNESLQQKAVLSKDLRTALKNPLSATSTGSEDKLAKMALADQASGVEDGLFNYTAKRGAAKAISKGDVGSGITSVPTRFAGKLALRASHGIDGAVKSDVPQMSLIEILRQAIQGK